MFSEKQSSYIVRKTTLIYHVVTRFPLERTSLWISRDGMLLRLYHDTGRTFPVRPRCGDDGVLRCGRRFRMETALLRAWNGECHSVSGTRAELIHPPAGLTADNVQYGGIRRIPQPQRTHRHIAPCELKALNAVTVTPSYSQCRDCFTPSAFASSTFTRTHRAPCGH